MIMFLNWASPSSGNYRAYGYGNSVVCLTCDTKRISLVFQFFKCNDSESNSNSWKVNFITNNTKSLKDGSIVISLYQSVCTDVNSFR